MKCKNKCIITGSLEDLKRLDEDFSSNFSMQDIIPVKNVEDDFERTFKWGVATKLKLQAYMFSDFAPEHIFFASDTDGPNEVFWKNVSGMYNLKIEYSFYNKQEGYIGLYRYENGMLHTYEYYEDEKSTEYIELLNRCKEGFVDIEPEETIENRVVISINDLRRRKND